MLTYVSYGSMAFTKQEVVRAIGVTFSETEVQGAKDVIWDRCQDILCDKPDRRGSVKRTVKMAYVQDIYDAILDLSHKSKIPRCVCDAVGMASWPIFNNTFILWASKKKFCHLERSYLLLLCDIGYNVVQWSRCELKRDLL